MKVWKFPYLTTPGRPIVTQNSPTDMAKNNPLLAARYGLALADEPGWGKIEAQTQCGAYWRLDELSLSGGIYNKHLIVETELRPKPKPKPQPKTFEEACEQIAKEFNL